MTTETSFVSERRLASANRRRRDMGKLSESIHGQYYYDRDGWVRYAEGEETEQARLLMAKGWKPISRSPRVEIITEHDHKWHAILRRPDGPALFPLAQIVAHNWHKA